MIRNFNEMLELVKKQTGKKVIIAAAQTESAIEAAILAKRENLADSILVGDKTGIIALLKEMAPELENAFEIIDTGSDLLAACTTSVNLAREGKGHVILKGKADTAVLLKTVLDKERGLRTSDLISDVLAYEHPDRVILMSDGGINLYPDLNEKVAIIKNAVAVGHALGNPSPKVALLCAVEVVNPKMPPTIDASIIVKMQERGQIPGCLIDGPLAFDNAIDMEAARIKNIKSSVAGDADILIVPNIEAGNILGKTLTYYCNYRVAHVVMGTKVPILIPSRADTGEIKMLCMALGILASSK
ncbi:MAG TPA: bifunctional enoyl-CoA hydratase/phosphate acetyltransferase [Candidatus Cloacimonadota bacterium]|nr:bifunctional enoyl-CoA hydratase/phosphate acetyltransferase [Candidatus Cloacimonadota bacterium]HPT72014.1 bifunctional enoyl-CoA hydratase/phosphate acetyltransferase [Candidatus Cloacimonadota bacterium]